MKIFDLFGSIYVDTKEAEKSLQKTESGFEKVGNKVSKFGGKVEKAGDKFTKTITAPIMALGTAALGGALSFEDAMAKVSTIADTTEVPLENLKKQILDLSNQTGIASSEIADNVYNAISAGQNTGDAVSFVSNATRLATAGFAESADTLDVLSTVMNAYGMEAKEVGNVSDLLIQTQNKGKTTVSELSASMGKVIPTANAFNVSLEQLCTGYALMTANGIATAESTTYMNGMLNELGKSSTGVSKILMDKTGKSFAELMKDGNTLGDVLGILQDYANETGVAMSDLWSSSEAGKAALVLTKNGVEGFNEALGDMTAAAKDGATTQAAFEKMETTSFKLKKSLNELKNAGIDLGGSILNNLMPYIEAGIEKVQKFSDWFASLNDEQKDTIVKLGLLVAAAGPVLTIAGKAITIGGTLISGVQKLSTVFGLVSKGAGGLKAGLGLILSPAGLIVVAIAAVVAAGVVLYKNWDSIKEAAKLFAEEVSYAFEGLKEKFNGIKEKMLEAVDKAGLRERFAAVKQAYEEHGGGVAGIVAASQEVIRQHYQAGYDAINTLTGGKLDEIKDRITENLSAVKQAYEDNGGGVAGIVAASQEVIRQHYQAGYDAINALTGGKLDEIKDKITEKLTAAGDFVQASVERIKGFFNFDWKLPDIKLPHFNLEGEFSLKPPSVPKLSVDWYAKAMNQPMIMTKPTAFGINANGEVMAGGEKGSEVVSGTDTLMGMIKSAVSDGSGSGITKDEMYSVIVAAVSYVLQTYGLQLLIELDTDKDELFKKVVAKNNEFKKMHQGKSALSDDRPVYA